MKRALKTIITFMCFRCRLHGDYESLSNCCTADVLVDFTGGLPEKLLLTSYRQSSTADKLENLHQRIAQCLDNGALVNCNINVRYFTLQLFYRNKYNRGLIL